MTSTKSRLLPLSDAAYARLEAQKQARNRQRAENRAAKADKLAENEEKALMDQRENAECLADGTA